MPSPDTRRGRGVRTTVGIGSASVSLLEILVELGFGVEVDCLRKTLSRFLGEAVRMVTFIMGGVLPGVVARGKDNWGVICFAGVVGFLSGVETCFEGDCGADEGPA